MFPLALISLDVTCFLSACVAPKSHAGFTSCFIYPPHVSIAFHHFVFSIASSHTLLSRQMCIPPPLYTQCKNVHEKQWMGHTILLIVRSFRATLSALCFYVFT